MAVAIAMLCGIHDCHLWLLILLSTCIGMFCGLLIELMSQFEISRNFNVDLEKQPKITIDLFKKLLFALGSACIFVPWLVIFCYFFEAATRPGSNMPNFVYAAFLGTFVMFLLFGINSYCCNILKLYSFQKAEMIYIILSFTAKTFLAADVFGGLNAQSDDDV